MCHHWASYQLYLNQPVIWPSLQFKICFQAAKTFILQENQKIKMATSEANQKSSDFVEYIKDLLECPVCLDTIESLPVYQCTNGHVICKDCIAKLDNCPICRNDSLLVRSLKLEKIVQRLEGGCQPKNEAPATANPNLQDWGQRSARVYRTKNGPNQELRIEINLQSNQEPLNSQVIINQEAVLPRKCLSEIMVPFIILCIFLLVIFIGYCVVKFLDELASGSMPPHFKHLYSESKPM